MPLDKSQCAVMLCCSKSICQGCKLASKQADVKAGRECVCAFCRATPPKRGPEIIAQIKKRVEAGDAYAIRMLGHCHIDGQEGLPLPRNVMKGIELLKKAAKLGDIDAHFCL